MEVRKALRQGRLEKLPANGGGSLRCFTTGDAGRFARLGERFGGQKIDWSRHVGTDELEGDGPVVTD
jgi:hypothetical protein